MQKIIALIGCCCWLVQLTAQPNIVAAEYFINTDPGFGKANPVTISTPLKNITNLPISVAVGSLPPGVHSLFIRSRDAIGKWSVTNRHLFYKPAGNNAIANSNIVKAEYFFDTDPGFGLATNIPVTAGADVQNINFGADVSGLSVGVHSLFIRSRNANGVWSITNRKILYKPSPASAIPPADITRVEYFIDTDPGFGNAVPVVVNPAGNIADFITPINISGLTPGDHKVFFRSLTSSGWSVTNAYTFPIASTPALPFINVNAVTKKTMCAADSIKISYDAKGTYNAGNIFNVQLSNANGSFASPVIIGSYTGINSAIIACKIPNNVIGGTNFRIRVSSTNPVVIGLAGSDALTIGNKSQPQSITGAVNTNGSFNYAYNIPAVTGSTWQWLVNGGIQQSGSNTNSVVNVWASPALNNTAVGSIKLVETNYGCTGDTSNLSVTIYKLRIVNSTAATACKGFGIIINANADGAFVAGNIITAQLSNATGSFAAPINIGTVALVGNGLNQAAVINATIPAVANGTNYRVRLISSTGSFIGDTSTAISIQKPDLGANITRSKCLGFTYDLSSVYNTAGLTYSYFTQAFESIANAAAVETGVYNIVASNSDGCKDTAVVTVSNFVKPNLGADITRSKCLGFTFSLAGVYTDASLTYTYFGSAFETLPNANVNDGVYNIVATNANGCKDTAQVTVTNFPKPNLGMDITRSTCVGFGFNLTNIYSDAALTYTYFTQSFATVSTPTSVGTGLYNIVATNSNGCKDTAQVTVINFVKPNIGADITGFKCAGFGYNLVANYSNAALTYNFYTQGFALVGNPSAVDIGVYNVVVTNSDGCRDTAIITVTNFAKPNLGANITRSKCLGFTYDLSAVYNTAGLTYSYFTQAFESIANAAAVETGVYNIVATNADGCKDTAVITVTNFVKPNLGADITRSKCIGFTYSLAGVYTDASLTYTYFGSAFETLPNTNVNEGVYNIIATNSNGCKDTAQVTVTNFPKPNLGVDITRSTCVGFGFNLTNIYSDAALSYAYFTQAFATVSTPSSVGAGVYNIIATNADGCKDTAQVTVNNFVKPNLGVNITRSTCSGFGYNLTTVYTDAALTYTYFTQAFATVSTPSSVGTGVYYIIATNTDGCIDTAQVTVNNFVKPNLGADITRSKCIGFTYDLSSVYNTAGLTYSYFTQAFESIANAAAVETGVYNIVATNADGCKDTAQITVTNFAKPNLGADITLYHVCAGETTNLVPLYNTTGLTVNWNTVNPTAAIPGIYRLIATNTSGCTDTAFVNVILEVATWTGAINNDWHIAGNWSTNTIPTLQTHVIIPAGKINQCAISTADAEAASIQVKAGAALQLKADRKLVLAQKCTLLPAN